MLIEKNRLVSDHPFTMAFQLDIAGAAGPLRLVAYDQAISFAGQIWFPYPIDVDLLEEPTHASLINLRVTTANADQQIQALLENYWAPIASPDWTVRIWQLDALQPDATSFASGEVFSVQQVTTDFMTAQFDLVAEGLTLSTIIPKRRYTRTNNFLYIPRAGR